MLILLIIIFYDLRWNFLCLKSKLRIKFIYFLYLKNKTKTNDWTDDDEKKIDENEKERERNSLIQISNERKYFLSIMKKKKKRMNYKLLFIEKR